MVTFSDPLYLLLLLPALGWMAYCARHMRGMTRERRIVAIALRTMVLVLLVLALAGLQTRQTNRALATAFVLDKSASMAGPPEHSAEQFVRQSLNALGPTDRAGLVVFGKDPVIDTDTGSLHSLGSIYANPDPSSTNIAAAIRLASATLPDGYSKRLVLLSDGNETSGDAAEAAEVAAAEGIQIDVAPVATAQSQRGEVLIQNVDLPPTVTKGQPFEMRVDVQSTQPSSATLHVDRDGTPVSSMPIQLVPGSNVIAVNQTAGDPGFYKYRVTVEAANDTDPRNNVGIGYVNVVGRPRVLLVEGQAGSAKALEAALAPHDMDVRRVDFTGLPTRPEDLQGYDSVIFSDFPAEQIADPQMHWIASAVQNDGLGFGMIGGDNSFLPGGYYETPIADVLPVDMNVRQRKTFPSTCIEIVVDASGSMCIPEDGVEKIKLAATAAASMVRMMPPNDLVGVAGSEETINFVVPIQPAMDKDKIAQECGLLDAGGAGIFVEPSLQFAETTMQPVNTKVKHLILMADGDDCKGQEGSFDLARKMVSEGMTVSVIAVGDGKDVGFCRTLAAIGKGYFYLANQAKELQRLVTQDSSILARSAIEEGPFLPKVDPTDEVLRGIDLQTMPPLYAYDLASDRPLARNPMRTNKDDPLLAYWQYGLGTTMAFMSDAQPKWARQWMGWQDFNSFWAQAVRETLPAHSADRITMDVHRDGGAAVLDVTAFDPSGAAINGLPLNVNVTDPNSNTEPLKLEQTGPGKYRATFDTGDTGGYVVTAYQPSPIGGKPALIRQGFSVAYPPEYQAIGPNTALLAEIAKTTGGQILSRPVQAFREASKPGELVRDMWPVLLFCAALLFVLDIAVRRIAIPFAEMRVKIQSMIRALAAFAAKRHAARVPNQSSQAKAISRLSRAKERADLKTDQNGTIPTKTLDADPSPNQSSRPSNGTGTPNQPSAPGTTTPQNTAQRLLDIKRRKNHD